MTYWQSIFCCKASPHFYLCFSKLNQFSVRVVTGVSDLYIFTIIPQIIWWISDQLVLWTCFLPGIIFMIMIFLCPKRNKNYSLIFIPLWSSGSFIFTWGIFTGYGKEWFQSFYEPTDDESWEQRDSFWFFFGALPFSFSMHCHRSLLTD